MVEDEATRAWLQVTGLQAVVDKCLASHVVTSGVREALKSIFVEPSTSMASGVGVLRHS